MLLGDFAGVDVTWNLEAWAEIGVVSTFKDDNWLLSDVCNAVDASVGSSPGVARDDRFVKVSWTTQTSIELGTESKDWQRVICYVLVCYVPSHGHKGLILAFVPSDEIVSASRAKGVSAHKHAFSFARTSISLVLRHANNLIDVSSKVEASA